jgi:hypothetical protein
LNSRANALASIRYADECSQHWHHGKMLAIGLCGIDAGKWPAKPK